MNRRGRMRSTGRRGRSQRGGHHGDGGTTDAIDRGALLRRPLTRGPRPRGARTVRTLGGRGTGRLNVERPSASDPVLCGMVEDLEESQPLERPLHATRSRTLQAKSSTPEGSQSLWSSIEVQQVGAAAEFDVLMEVCSDPPSPALHVECGGSGVSTPRSVASTSQPRTPSSHVECGGSEAVASTSRNLATPRSVKRLQHIVEIERIEGEPSPKSKRCLIPSSSSSSRGRPLRSDEILDALHFGSDESLDEDDDDDDGDDDVGLPPLLVPRSDRIYLDGDLDEQDQPVNAAVSLEWPPQPHSGAADNQPGPTLDRTAASDDNPPSGDPTAPTMGPCNKFDFQWRAFPQTQIPPGLRREKFSNINCGPTVPLVSPYDAFTAIWDRTIMEHIAEQTNIYAQQLATDMLVQGEIHPHSRITKWRDTDVEELYVFFAIILSTGIVAKSRLEEYWQKTQDMFFTPGFSAAMGFDRYQLLSKCLHFQNNENCKPELMTRAEAKLFKVQPILDHLNNKFSQLYNMSQNIALDESLTMWKGWLDINQFIRNKAATVGIKTYEVCESQTGYLWRFEVHAGHEDTSDLQDPVSGIVPALVLRLLNGLEHKGHTVWMDNYYNSPALARELKVRGFDCVGTLRTNRQFVPVELTNLTKSDMVVGQVSGCTSGDVDLVVWRDRNRVALISTYHGLATVKCGDTLKPSIVPDYNVCMGGVDRKDQMIAMYPIERKRTKIWYKKFFRRLLNVSVLNAYILYKSHHSISHRAFRKALVRELISKHARAQPQRVDPPSGHFPAQYDFVAGKLHERQRRYCTVCNKRTTSYCKTCNVPLCVFTCFEPHHTPQ